MGNFDLKRKFDVVLSWFTSFGYFTNEKYVRLYFPYEITKALENLELRAVKIFKSGTFERLKEKDS